MCLILRFKTKAEAIKGKIPLIAKKDIEVYKSLDGADADEAEYESPWQTQLKWNKGDHMYQKSTGPKDPVFGLSKIESYNGDHYFSINAGLHSVSTPERARSAGMGFYTFKMIIPKGSKYYTDGDCYVSDNLIFPSNAQPYKFN